MMLSTILQGLALSTLPSLVLGTAIPSDRRDLLKVDDVNADVIIYSGSPELLTVNADVLIARDEEESFISHLFPRALSKDQSDALKAHNDARKEKKLKALLWDNKLQAEALKWAKELAKNDKMKHSTGDQRKGQGENLAYAYSSAGIKDAMTQASKMWIAEKKKYKGEAIPKGDFGGYGHYTQVMWKSTTRVGIACAKSKKGSWYTVARYSPPGNFVGQKPY